MKVNMLQQYMFVLVLIAPFCLLAQARYPFPQADRIGFIDANGVIVIPPVFRAAGRFAEGLAPARTEGLYGFIDSTGNWAIAPQFEYATHFKDGFAIACNGEMPFYINKKGEKALQSQFPKMGHFINGNAIVKSAGGNYGVLNTAGKLVLDTLYIDFKHAEKGRFILERKKTTEAEADFPSYEEGVMDTFGNIIIPFGKYKAIESVQDGGFTAWLPDSIAANRKRISRRLRTDLMGKPLFVFQEPNPEKGTLQPETRDGFLRIFVPLAAPDSKDFGPPKGYMRLLDATGRIILDDTSYAKIGLFSNSRAFAQKQNSQWVILDTNGARVSDQVFSEVLEDFDNGYAFVKQNRLWGLIDTMAGFVFTPQFKEVSVPVQNQDYFIFKQPNAAQKKGARFGLADYNGRVLMPALIDRFLSKFPNEAGVIYAIQGDTLLYINEKGLVVRREQITEGSAGLQQLNLDYQLESYFFADTEAGYNNLGDAPFVPATDLDADHDFPQSGLSITVRPEERDTLFGQYRAMAVYVANTSAERVWFNAADGCLYMSVQALNPEGQWQDIESFWDVSCGNSFHSISLPGKQYWRFLSPEYDGAFKTKLRIRLEYALPTDEAETIGRTIEEVRTIYSNTYDGAVNPAQFWHREGYFRYGLFGVGKE
ncbi:MAG: WG repeat-containing protein [Chitinophagales bacterium]|nr:WG repeat-containing protein [Chitinophagales bacterium]